ncbi:MAG: UDP-N-acetylmuramate--L-alanine ligase [bacterium]
MFRKAQHIYFVGIGGSGMCGIAEVLLNLGYQVSGSDLKESRTTGQLRELGGNIYIGHRPENLAGNIDVMVTSTAVKEDNAEVITARERVIPVIARAEMLAELMRLKYGVAVAGAHGKTSVTSMVATIMNGGGLDPTVVIGGRLNILGSNAYLGKGDFLVAEADESDGSFLKLSPTIAVITNIDAEHLDHYRNLDNIKEAFLAFANKTPFYGAIILCLDDRNIQAVIPRLQRRYLTYGISSQADLVATDIEYKEAKSLFKVRFKGEDLGRFMVASPGQHTVYNSLAAICVALELEIPPESIKESLSVFSGADRRFQVKGESGGVLVIDDYGHHPTEIKATLAAARNGWARRIVAVFQPHRYTRSRDLLQEFYTAFYQADLLVVTGIYPAGEAPIPGISGQTIVEGVKEHGHKNVVYEPEFGKISSLVAGLVEPGDMVITLGAGDIWKAGESILNLLQDRK